jgi:carbon storage regulator
MLVLARTAGTKIMIGDDVVITILSCEGGQVKIGIAAPKEIAVHREEIYNKVKVGKTKPVVKLVNSNRQSA